MQAKAIENAITQAIEYDGEIYGRSGWNSDRHVAYYRSDVKPALAAKW